MKTRTIVALFAIFCLSLAGLVKPDSTVLAKEKVITLKFANYLPPQSAHTKIGAEFCKDIETRSNGRIKVKYFVGGSLLKGSGMYKGIESGIADIGFAHVYYTPSRMPVTELIGLPLGSPSAWVSSHALNDLYFKVKPKEYDKVKVLWLSGTMTSTFFTNKPINTMADLQGLTIRGPGVIGEIVRSLGATPAPTPIMEMYDALSKGVIDGNFGNFEIIAPFKLTDVTKYASTSWRMGSTFPFYTIMNKNKYKKLPADLKEIFDNLCGDYREKYALMWNRIEIDGLNFGKQKGMTYIDIPEAEAAKWNEAVAPVIEKQIKKMVSKGFAEADVREWIAYLEERIDYYTEKQIEYRIPSPTGPDKMRPENIGS